MRSGMKWLLALAMFVAVPAGCLTESAPGQKTDTQQLSTDESTPEQSLSCPLGWEDCCGDGICYRAIECPYILCSGEVPAAPPREPEALDICPDGLVDCCGDGRCFPTWVCGSSQHDCEGPPPGLRM